MASSAGSCGAKRAARRKQGSDKGVAEAIDAAADFSRGGAVEDGEIVEAHAEVEVGGEQGAGDRGEEFGAGEKRFAGETLGDAAADNGVGIAGGGGWRGA